MDQHFIEALLFFILSDLANIQKRYGLAMFWAILGVLLLFAAFASWLQS